jgi:hypothetical protein
MCILFPYPPCPELPAPLGSTFFEDAEKVEGAQTVKYDHQPERFIVPEDE